MNADRVVPPDKIYRLVHQGRFAPGCFSSMDLPTALPSKTTHVAIPMIPGTMPTYLGLKNVIKNNRMPAINSRYDG
jgi:hypothetical protein